MGTAVSVNMVPQWSLYGPRTMAITVTPSDIGKKPRSLPVESVGPFPLSRSLHVMTMVILHDIPAPRKHIAGEHAFACSKHFSDRPFAILANAGAACGSGGCGVQMRFRSHLTSSTA